MDYEKQELSKLDQWLLTYDHQKGLKYILALFVIGLAYNVWQTYEKYIAAEYFGAVSSAFSAGLFLATVFYYILIMMLNITNASLRRSIVEATDKNIKLDEENRAKVKKSAIT